jgi:hypothetical protein
MPIGGADFTNKTHVKWLANVVFKRHNNIRVRYPYWSSWLTKNNIPSGIQIHILWYVQDIEFSEIDCEFFTDLYPSDYSPTFKKLFLYKFKQYQWRNYPSAVKPFCFFRGHCISVAVLRAVQKLSKQVHVPQRDRNVGRNI